MSQSFVNTDSFPLEFELGLGARRTEGWVWPKLTFRFQPFKDYSRFLRYPRPDDGLGYRAMRVVTIFALRARLLVPCKVSGEAE